MVYEQIAVNRLIVGVIYFTHSSSSVFTNLNKSLREHFITYLTSVETISSRFLEGDMFKLQLRMQTFVRE